MAGSEHLSDREIESLLMSLYGDGQLDDSSRSHLLWCSTCQGRLVGIVGSGISPAFDCLGKLTPDEIRREDERAKRDLKKAELIISGFLDTGDLASFNGASPYALAVVAIRMAPGLRFHDVPGFQALLTRVLAMLEGEPRNDKLVASVSAHLLAELGNCIRIRGDLLGARPIISKALDLSRESVDPLSRGEVEMLGATYFEATGELHESMRWARTALGRFRSIGAHTYTSRANFLLASLAWRRGELDETIEQLTGLREQPLDDITRAAVTQLLTKCLVLQGEYFRVPQLIRELRRMLTDWEDNPVVVANTKWLLALYLGGTGAFEKATTSLGEVAETFGKLGQPREVTLALVDQAYFELRLGRHLQAAKTASTALALSTHCFPYAALRELVEAVRSDTVRTSDYKRLRLALEQARQMPPLPEGSAS